MRPELAISIDDDLVSVLDLGVLVARLPGELGTLSPLPRMAALLSLDAETPVTRDEALRVAVRDLLRRGGYKPTGRGKPSSEYLLRAASDGTLGSVNPAVDAGNAVSLHSGIPISLVDTAKLAPSLRVRCADDGARFVFNRSGQEIDVSGLVGLEDSVGPCANAVKDAQRTKTDESTRQVLCLLWAPRKFDDVRAKALAWLAELLRASGAQVEERG